MTDVPMREVVQRGLWFEEFEPGTRYLHRPGRTVTEADNVLFTTLTMNTQGTIVANLGFAEVAFPAPLFHGDTLYSETVVVGSRESASRPGQGIVTLVHIGRNQHGVEVARATRSVLVWFRDAGERQGLAPASDEVDG